MTPDADGIVRSPDRQASEVPETIWQRIEALCERAFIAFALYTFSIGPMYWTWYAGKYATGSAMIAALYEPLWRLAGWIPAFGDWLNWYVRWWIL